MNADGSKLEIDEGMQEPSEPIQNKMPAQLELCFGKIKYDKDESPDKCYEEEISVKDNSLSEKGIPVPLKAPKQLGSRKTFTKKTHHRPSGLNMEASKKQQQRENFHNGNRLQIFFALLGKILSLIRRAKNLMKYNKIENLTQAQENLIGDKSSFLFVEGEVFLRKKNLKNHSKDLVRRESLQLIDPLWLLLEGILSKVSGQLKIFHPSNRTVLVWRGLGCLFILFELFSQTIKLFFRLDWDAGEDFLIIQFIILKVYLALDIIVVLNTGFYQSGTVILSRKLIFKNYLRKAMIQDLFALVVIFIPYIYDEGCDISKPALVLSSKNLFKLLFLFKLKDVKIVMHVLEETLYFEETYEASLALIKLISKILFIAHWISCFWNLAAWVEKEQGLPSWQQKLFYTQDQTLVSWTREYLYSSYWSLTTMITVGYGDISPQGDLEVVVSSLGMVFGCGFFAYAINMIGSIVEKFDRKGKNLRKDLRIIKKYMKRNKINYALQVRVCKYLEHIWLVEELETRSSEQDILNKLSDALKKDVLVNGNGRVLANFITFTEFFTDETLEKASQSIKTVHFAPGDIIFKEGQVMDNRVYFLVKGTVEISTGSLRFKRPKFLKQLKEGECFGQLSFFTEQPRTVEARSVGFSTLYTIEREEFLDIISDNLHDRENFFFIRDSIHIYKNLSKLGIHCESCGEDQHTIKDCPFLQMKLNKELVIRRYLYTVPNERKTIIRRRTSKFPNALLMKNAGSLTYLFSNTGALSPTSSEGNEQFNNGGISDVHSEYDPGSLTSIEVAAPNKKFERNISVKPDRSLKELNSLRENEMEEMKDVVSPLLKPNTKYELRRGKREMSIENVAITTLDQLLVRLTGMLSFQSLQTQANLKPLNKSSSSSSEDPQYKSSQQQQNNMQASEDNLQQSDLPMIFGGLNTEKMADFQIYFPYNNSKNVIEFLRKKSSKKKGKSMVHMPSNKSFALGLIQFRDQQNFFIRNRKGKRTTLIGKKKGFINKFISGSMKKLL